MTAVRLICSHRGVHRPVTVLRYQGPLPVPEHYKPRLRGSTLELRCSHCGHAPRPGDEGLRQLLLTAAALPGQTLDINPQR